VCVLVLGEMARALVAAALVAAVVGRQTLWQPPGVVAPLATPEPALCESRSKIMKFGDHNYYFSWDLAANQLEWPVDVLGQPTGRAVNWTVARDECRRQCMDLISIESHAENEWLKTFISKRNLNYIWTSGRLCDFAGCETRQDMQPLRVNGWFWGGNGAKLPPTDAAPGTHGWPERPWSQTGHFGEPQPDNAEQRVSTHSESCLAVMNERDADGIAWHDRACFHEMPYICEDSPSLLLSARLNAVRDFD